VPQPSYVAGPSDRALIDASIGDYLQRAASRHARVEAVVSCHQRVRLTYGDLLADVERAARALITIGVAPGDRVGIWSTNCAEWPVLYYAAASIGAILVAINPAYRVREVEYVLNDAGVTVLVLAQGFRDVDYARTIRALAPDVIDGDRLPDAPRADDTRLPHLRTVVHLASVPDGARAVLSWPALIARHVDTSPGQLRERTAAVRPLDPAAVLYTSGTTGAPKGAVLTHRALLNCGQFVGERLRYGVDDRICLPVPFYHAFGCVLGGMAALVHGATLVLPSAVFHPEECLNAIDAERCTSLYGVPTMFIAQVEHASLPQYSQETLRTGIMAGAPCPAELMRRLIERMHLPELTVSFGMTETLATLHTALDDTIDRRVSTVGTPLPHVECKIAGAAGGVAPRGTAGELCTRSYGVMLGYWNNPAATAAAIDEDGWMHTGDLAVMDDEGYVAIVGRLKDMIIRAGEKVYPGDVESFLYTHPHVAEVHVIGVPDVDYGEELCAWIRVRDGAAVTAEDIRRFCRREIAGFKIPRYIRFVDEFPSTVTGKVQKFRMREISAAEIGVGGRGQ